jgi:short-subunit dehydrogenase
MSKNIWITGASSGIGKALAIKFANKGWQVAVSARRENLLQDLNKENSNIHPFPLNVTDLENTKDIFKNILKKFINIDLCVFGSAIYDPNYENEINEKKIRKIMEINFFGTVNCIKAVEKYFKTKKQGHISIISSVAGYRGLPKSEGYGASKAALNNLTESLFVDFKKYNVRISLISPGFIKTPMTDKNKFKMPFLRSADFAANKIYKGLLHSNNFEIDFPKQLTMILKILRVLPYRMYFFLIEKLTKNSQR